MFVFLRVRSFGKLCIKIYRSVVARQASLLWTYTNYTQSTKCHKTSDQILRKKQSTIVKFTYFFHVNLIVFIASIFDVVEF